MRKLSMIDEDLFHKSVEREYTRETRKEDDVDTMDIVAFKSYLEKRYKSIPSLRLDVYETSGSIVYVVGLAWKGAIYFRDPNSNAIMDHAGVVWYEFHDNQRDYEKRLLKEYAVNFCGKKTIGGDNMAGITLKDGKMTNKECVKIMDIIIDGIKNEDF